MKNKILALFLNLLWKDIEADPSKLVPYTKEMLARDRSLIEGVEVD